MKIILIGLIACAAWGQQGNPDGIRTRIAGNGPGQISCCLSMAQIMQRGYGAPGDLVESPTLLPDPPYSMNILTAVDIIEMLDRQRMDLAAMEQLQYQGVGLLPNLVARELSPKR